MSNNIAERVYATVAKSLNVKPEEVFGHSQFASDLGADSLDTVELVMALEEEFNFEITDDAAEQIRTVNDAVNYVEAHFKGENPASSSNNDSSPAA
jgi:acyl carrier protein